MIKYYNNALSVLTVEAFKDCNAKVLLLKNIADSLERVVFKLVPLKDYIRDLRVCTPMNGGYRFTEQEVRGFNSAQLIPEFRGTNVGKLMKQVKDEIVILVPPIKEEMPSQPNLVNLFLEKLNTQKEMDNKKILILTEVE